MVVKKQLRKISKKILVLGLATSIIFTSCFSTKKIEAHATGVAAGLTAYTLYEICLYIGGITATALGLGYAYENRDDIAQLGKTVIDNMTDLSSSAWVLGSSTIDGDYVYGTEALQEVKDTQWTVIQGGGQSPKNDNDDDGDEDEDDRTIELNLNKYFLTTAGLTLLKNNIKTMYDSWVAKDFEAFSQRYGQVDDLTFSGYEIDENGYYCGFLSMKPTGTTEWYDFDIKATGPIVVTYYDGGDNYSYFYCKVPTGFQILNNSSYFGLRMSNETIQKKGFYFKTNLPVLSKAEYDNFMITHTFENVLNAYKTYRIADWLADDEAWIGILEDLALSLRSLQGLSDLAQEFANNILEYKPTVNVAGDTLNDYITNTYAPVTNVFITQPTYYPSTSVAPKLDISVFPNYDIYIESGGGADTPDDSGGEDDIPEIDLDGLLSIFNILFYLIMIIVMLIYLFLSCLAFIVMIFRIPASSTMLPEEMVMGFDHLKTIMIPGMNISIYGFAMALIYMFIIFAVIKLIRLEINDFKFPRSYK